MTQSEQLQIGQRVLYVPEGVWTEVIGYEWKHCIGGPPSIVRYELSCGIYACREHLTRQEAGGE